MKRHQLKFLIKSFILLLFFFSQIHVSSQTIEGKVLDANNNMPLEYANIALAKKKIGAYTKKDGSFTIEILKKEQLNDTLLISFLGYKTQKIKVKDLINNKMDIVLEQDNQALDEVILTTTKLKYSSTKKIKLTKEFKKFSSSVPYGFENAILIKNNKNKKGKLVKVSFYVEKNENQVNGYKVVPAFYRLSFYKIDSITKQPDSPIIKSPILIENTNNTQKITISLEDYNIPCFKNGVFIGIETLKPSEFNTTTKFVLTSPSLVWTYDNERLTYQSYRAKRPWKALDYKLKVKKLFKKEEYKYYNPLLDVEVKFEK